MNSTSYPVNFYKSIKNVLGIEGGCTNNKYDTGGKTNFGITESLAEKYEYTPSELTQDIAIEIYYKEFWEKYNLDLIKDSEIVTEVFEFGINSGMKRGIKTLQRSFNSLHALSEDKLLTEDGILGPKTAKVINEYEHKHSLLKMQNIIQGMFYLFLAEGNKEMIKEFDNHTKTQGSFSNKQFIRGWIEKRVELK